ncbi:hypothetical protein BC628DRAFT_1341680 [Trametes gibbosa]|nr:hypothetical protein BC628DRAFT_1341680 [Trametes gibbosa]
MAHGWPSTYPMHDQQLFFDGDGITCQKVPQHVEVYAGQPSGGTRAPCAMVTLVYMAIHASLLQWRTGKHMKIELTGNTFVDKYRKHITFMHHTQDKNSRRYHAQALHGSNTSCIACQEECKKPCLGAKGLPDDLQQLVLQKEGTPKRKCKANDSDGEP